jgi:hypothetical protein
VVRSPSSPANAYGLNELARREVLERRYSANRPLRLNIAHDLVGDIADDRDIARVPGLRPAILWLHACHADHRDDLKDHWFILLFTKTRLWERRGGNRRRYLDTAGFKARAVNSRCLAGKRLVNRT